MRSSKVKKPLAVPRSSNRTLFNSQVTTAACATGIAPSRTSANTSCLVMIFFRLSPNRITTLSLVEVCLWI